MHIVAIESNDIPNWFSTALDIASRTPQLHSDETWIWKWNRIFDNRVFVRNGIVFVEFESEAHITMFALRMA